MSADRQAVERSSRFEVAPGPTSLIPVSVGTIRHSPQPTWASLGEASLDPSVKRNRDAIECRLCLPT